MRKGLSIVSRTDAKSRPPSKPSGELDLQYLKALNLIKFPISKVEIFSVKNKTRDKEEEGLKKIIDVFNQMVRRYQELPADVSFSRVISALRKLDQLEQALELFNLIKISANPKFKDQIVGAYSYTAIVEVFRQQIEQANDSSDKLAILANAEKLWEEYKSKKYKVDGYILTDMMCIYASINYYRQAVDLFSDYRDLADLPMYSQYIISLMKMDRLEVAKEQLANMKKQYTEKKDKRRQDTEAMYCVYDTFITHYFSHKKDQTQAIQVFEEASKSGFYANNQLQKMGNLIKLDFHWDKDYKKIEGGLPLTVAKVAFLYFMQQVAQQEFHGPAQIITGGHIATQAKLKAEFPDYLQKEYSVKVNWNENPKILEFEIPYNEIRKIRFIHDIWAYMDSQEERFFNKNALIELKRRYRADLRRNNEGRVHKHFSEEPSIPSDLINESLKLAKDSIDYFNKGKYGEAEKCYKKLIELEPKHPWPYVQLGWVLHRTERFDEAIAKYQEAIALVNSGNASSQSEFLSEVYRKMGWAYDRKHRRTRAREDLDKAFKYYEQAIGLNKNNIEIYNNWGIGLARIGRLSEAMEKFKIVIDKNIQHDEACIHLGNCCKQLEKHEEAEKWYQEAISRSEKYDEGNSAAWAYQELGDLYYQQYKKNLSNADFFKRACDAFNNCLNLQPTRDQAHQGLAKVYKLNEDNEKSKEHREKANMILPLPEEKQKRNQQQPATMKTNIGYSIQHTILPPLGGNQYSIPSKPEIIEEKKSDDDKRYETREPKRGQK